MALLRRSTSYVGLALFIVYALYQLSFPYKTADSLDPYGGRRPKHPEAQKVRPKLKPQRGQKYPSFDWPNVPLQHSVTAFAPLPTGDPVKLPKIQHPFKDEEQPSAKKVRETRRDVVKKQFLKCWRNYRSHAWMHDEIRPMSGEVTDHFGGWAATLIDALDTLWIMGFKEEFNSAIEDVEMIDFGYTGLEKINVFETNIRHLGGLLAAYELSEDERLLDKATEVGEMLYHAFDTPNHMPITRWDFRAAGEGKPQIADDRVLLAEIGSFTMEFTRLSQHTGDPKFYDAVKRVTDALDKQIDQTKLPGMWPIVVNARKMGTSDFHAFTLGSMADSAYEYLPKTYALMGGQSPTYRKLYEKTMATAIEHLLFRPSNPNNLDMRMSGELSIDGSTSTLTPVLQHLACYTGGMLALGGKLFKLDEHVKLGHKITETCVWAYKTSPTGIMPEVAHLLSCDNTTNCTWTESAWHDGVAARADPAKEQDPLKNIDSLRLSPGFTSIEDRRYMLRPEALESVFVMYRITGDQAWQEAAWDMISAVLKSTDTALGNSALLDVSADTPPRLDSMESFWFSETLKYAFLIFSKPDVISLDDWVFNTEAHPLRIPKPQGRSWYGL